MKWTKASIRELRGAIETAWLRVAMYRPDPAAWRAHLAAHRKEIAVAGVRELRNLSHDRAVADRNAAAHFRDNPNVYGDHTPEMIERFTRLAAVEERAVAKMDALIAHVEAEGLPPELETYDPGERTA